MAHKKRPLKHNHYYVEYEGKIVGKNFPTKELAEKFIDSQILWEECREDYKIKLYKELIKNAWQNKKNMI